MNVHLLKFLLLLFFSFLWTPHAQNVETRNSLKPGETLNSSSRLVSPSTTFLLTYGTYFVRSIWVSAHSVVILSGLQVLSLLLLTTPTWLLWPTTQEHWKLGAQVRNRSSYALLLNLPITLWLLYRILEISSSKKCTPMDLRSGWYGKLSIIPDEGRCRVWN